MLLALRKILFYILLILYFVITPYLILYGLGYVFNPSEGELHKTGLVSIASEPNGASIYIEGRKFSKKTPAVLRGLLPGSYKVRVARKGFESWQKEIRVFPEKAIKLDPVILVSQKPEREELTNGSYENLFPQSSDYRIFAVAGKNFSDLRKVDLLFKKESPLEEFSGNEKVEILDWKTKKDSSVVLFHVKRGGGSGYLLYDLEREKILKDLTGRIPKKVDWIDWSSKKPEAIYFLKDQQLKGVIFEDDLAFQLGEGDILGFGVRRNKLYFLKNDFSFWQAGLQGENSEVLFEKEDAGLRIFSGAKSKYYQIEMLKKEMFQKELLLFVSDRGSLSSNWPPYRLVERGVLGFKQTQSRDVERILYWTKQEIGIFNFALNPEEEEAFPPKIVLYQSGKDLRQAFWAFDNSHIIFQDGNEVFLLEAGDHTPYLVRNIQTVARHTEILYNDHQHTLYYLDADHRKMMKRKMKE